MRHIHRIVPVTLSATLALMVAGTALAQSPAPGTGAATLAGTEWALVSMGAGGTQAPVPEGVAITLQIDGDLAGGNSGCNMYRAPVTSMDPGLTFGPAVTTMMACPDPQMTVEQEYLAALAMVADYTIVDQTLTLLDSAGASILIFEQAPTATVVGSWIATGVNNGKAMAGVESPPVGVTLTADFAADGAVSGDGGCNRFSGGYSYTADTIAIGPLMSTAMSCGDARDAVEQQYLAALGNARVWAIVNGLLELRDDSGAIQVIFAKP